MKLLAVLVNYGSEQLDYLEQVVNEIRTFEKYDVRIILHTNITTGVSGIDEEKIIKLDNYQLLPLTCRKTIWENKDEYDVFYYGENDHFLQEHHIDKHLQYSEILPENKISGLIQYEVGKDGLWFPAYHARYEWDYASVERHGGLLFAHFTNIHQASFILTRKQLLMIGDVQEDFTKFFGRSKYSAKCKANTDIYQLCGIKKMICIDEFDLNLIHHLPNLYVKGEKGRLNLGSDNKRMRNAIDKLKNTPTEIVT